MATVEAKVFCSDEARFKKLLKDAATLQPNRNVLAVTGIGVLLSYQSLWLEDQWPKAKTILESWKQLKGLFTKENVLRACDKPFRCMKSKQYLQIVSKVKAELKNADDKKKLEIYYKMAAMAIVDAGFQSFTSLAFAEGDQLARYTSNLATKALITELVDKATYEAKLKTRVRDLEFDESVAAVKIKRQVI